uniref:PX domain-containing protein n=1 Tax=Odontella aurita TaxID=265563 RepID=A0A7S4HT17_9STRA
MSIIALQSYVDFDDVRLAREHNEELEVNWSEPGCRGAVRRLILVIESALLHGLRGHRRRGKGEPASRLRPEDGDDGPDSGGEEKRPPEGGAAPGVGTAAREEDVREKKREEGVPLSDRQIVSTSSEDVPEDAAHLKASTLSVVLMEMTEDIDAFERRVAEEERESMHGGDAHEDEDEDDGGIMIKPSASEISTLRTLIAAWLHTGQVYRTLSVFVQSKQTILGPFYHRKAFIRNEHASDFVRQLRLLDGVDILVDTMSVLSSPSINLSDLALLMDEIQMSGHDETDDAASAAIGDSVHGEALVGQHVAVAGSAPSSGASTPGASTPPVTVAEASRPAARPQETHQPEQPRVTSLVGGVRANFRNNRQRLSRLVGGGGGAGASAAQQQQHRSMPSDLSHDVLTRPNASRQPPVAATAADGTVSVSASVSAPGSESAARDGAPASMTQRKGRKAPADGSSPAAMAAATVQQQHHRSSVPPHLNYFRNSAFASSLRVERDRRMRSWSQVTMSVSAGGAKAASDGGGSGNVDFICRTRGLTDRDLALHRECHRLARCFYSSTNTLAIRDTLAKKEAGATTGVEGDGKEGGASKIEGSKDIAGSAITLETISARRRIEVPDDDSSFLLRAQPRPLQPIAVHRDQRNHDLSYKCFAATFEEPVVHPETKRYRGGRCVRKCYLKYFPSDRTASISPLNEGRCMDRRRKLRSSDSQGSLASAAGAAASTSSFLPAEFKKQRHLCNKWAPIGSSGTLTGSILSSSVMEPADFNSVPRTGKAIDFVYRMSLFDRPVVELGGKKFSVQDSTTMGPHRADASSLEMSDASLSTTLLLYGSRFGFDNVESGRQDPEICSSSGDIETSTSQSKETEAPTNVAGARLLLGEDGAPLVYMKLSTSSTSRPGASEETSGDQSGFEVRPFRPSFIRAALLVTSARQEAQLQCLLACVRAGSARNATKAKTEALLQPCLRLLEFANSKKREKQSILLRDLKLGINHIDREQLRRNGILYPRYPTILRRLSAKIEYAMQAKPAGNLDLLGTPAMVLYKIKCVAICERIDTHDDDGSAYGLKIDQNDGRSNLSGILYKEEWAVLRPYRDFSVLHKHLKSQVAASESSASAGARLVGAATAALTFGEGGQRQRKGLIPSLGQATKAGALGVTKRAIERRKEILNDYLAYLLSPNHLLGQCPELLRFLGAHVALPAELEGRDGKPDNLGRIEFSREKLETDIVAKIQLVRKPEAPSGVLRGRIPERTAPQQSNKKQDSRAVDPTVTVNATRNQEPNQEVQVLRRTNQQSRSTQQLRTQQVRPSKKSKRSNTIQMAAWASIKTRIDQVKLSQVRNAVFQFLRYLFDLDNASFFSF